MHTGIYEATQSLQSAFEKRIPAQIIATVVEREQCTELLFPQTCGVCLKLALHVLMVCPVAQFVSVNVTTLMLNGNPDPLMSTRIDPSSGS
jgi:hypothetical protein